MEVPDGTEIIYVCNICNATACEMDVMQDHMTSHAFTSDFDEISAVSSALVEKGKPTSEPEGKITAEEAAQRLWTPTSTLFLIELCKKYDSEFESSVKKYVWQKIADSVTKESGISITAQQCDTKWKGLKNMYKQIKKHNETSGNSPKYWEYFDTINELLHKKPEINPIATCSARKGLTINSSAPSASSQSSSSVSTDSERSMTPKPADFQSSFSRKRKILDNPTERRHKEKMARQDRYLDILERLTKAVEKVGGQKSDQKD